MQSQRFVRRPTLQSGVSALFSRDAITGLFTTAHHAAMVLGGAAIVIWCLMFVKPELADHLNSLIPANNDAATKPHPVVTPSFSNLMLTSEKSDAEEKSKLFDISTSSAKPSTTQPQQQRITSWLSKRYRLASEATDMFVSAAYGTANEIKLDPLLILAVMAIESGFNPFAESPMGAQGLMQVMSKIHHEKFQDLGGVKAALNPIANIKVGSLILKDYVTRAGSIPAGLKLYVGAATSDNDAGYGSKVLAEYAKLKDVALGKNVPITNSPTATAKPVQPSIKSEPANIIDAANSESIPVPDEENKVAAI